VTCDEIVEEALCSGWIDNRSGTVDAERSKLWLAPRKRGSGWSRLDKERVARLAPPASSPSRACGLKANK